MTCFKVWDRVKISTEEGALLSPFEAEVGGLVEGMTGTVVLSEQINGLLDTDLFPEEVRDWSFYRVIVEFDDAFRGGSDYGGKATQGRGWSFICNTKDKMPLEKIFEEDVMMLQPEENPYTTVGELIADQDYDYISYHELLPDDIAQDVEMKSYFAGVCQSKDGKLLSLDGDSYNEDDLVYAHETWARPKDGINHGLTVLVQFNDPDILFPVDLLKEAIDERGISHKELAEMLNTTETKIDSIMAGESKVSCSMAYTIRQLFPMNDIFARKLKEWNNDI